MITRAYTGVTELYLSTDEHGDRPGVFPQEYDLDGCPLAHYGEENGSLVLLFAAFYNLSEIITFLKEHPVQLTGKSIPRWKYMMMILTGGKRATKSH